MLTEDCVYGELVKACYYCGSTNIIIKDSGTLLFHKCNNCGKKNTLTKRIKEKESPKKEIKYPQTSRGKKHRMIVEKRINRKLSNEEIIHHIDLDKKNFKESNLLLTDSTEHPMIHKNLRDLSIDLLKKGIIKFDKNKREYYYESM